MSSAEFAHSVLGINSYSHEQPPPCNTFLIPQDTCFLSTVPSIKSHFLTTATAPDKRDIEIIVLLVLYINICCGYSLEASKRGASNVYPQHMFLCRNKIKINLRHFL